jgi:hypothetical protein
MKGAAFLVAVVLLAGCGGAHRVTPRQPRLPAALAGPWRTQADAVAAALASGDGCLAQQRAVALRTSVIAAVNSHTLPPRFQEQLVGAVNDLAGRIHCAPPAPAPAPVAHGHSKPPKPPKPPKHHGHGHGHGKHKK